MTPCSIDVNAVVAGYLRDLAFVQPTKPQMFGYKRASSAILRLAAIPRDRIVNCWTLERLQAWLSDPWHERRLHTGTPVGAHHPGGPQAFR